MKEIKTEEDKRTITYTTEMHHISDIRYYLITTDEQLHFGGCLLSDSVNKVLILIYNGDLYIIKVYLTFQ